MVKHVEIFFQIYNKCLVSENSRFGQILFNLTGIFAVPLEKYVIHTFFKVFFDNLECGKRIIVLEKSLKKVLNFGSKNLYEPWSFKQCRRCSVSNPLG